MSNENQHKPGYKHTPLGWIPEEWEIKELNKVAEIQQGVSKGKQIEDSKMIEVPYMRVANIKDGFKDLSEIKTIKVDKNQYVKYLLKKDDILITEGGDPDKLGRGAKWNEEVKECIYQNHLFRIRALPDLIPDYFFNYLQSKRAKTYFLTCAKQTTGIASINSSQVKEMPVLLPVKQDQINIAQVFSIWDEAITKTQQLITQIQQRNKGLIQQLLTGKKRLTGFEKTKDYFLAIHSFAEEVSEKNKTDIELIVLSCTKYEGLVPSLEYFGRKIYSDDLTTYKIVSKNCFAYATNHIEEGSIGYQAKYEQALISPMYTVFKTNDSVDDEYLYKVLKSHHYIHEYQKRMEGSIDRRGGLRWDEFSKIKVLIPGIEEQRAVAEIFNKADEEVKLHQQQLTTLQLQKKGLMQKLLTGEVRVKI